MNLDTVYDDILDMILYKIVQNNDHATISSLYNTNHRLRTRIKHLTHKKNIVDTKVIKHKHLSRSILMCHVVLLYSYQ